jgi:2-oxoisovalerate dehydrogenase E1 component
MNKDIKLAIKIRSVEENFLEMFSEGLLNGTVHTCIGQELSGVGISKFLNENDFVFSNHRCHGHYISFTKKYKNLIDELMGKESGVCGGIGGSQHIASDNFFSNGPQGSLAPVAVGVAEGLKRKKNNSVAVCFIGDGTMGEGIIYESMNLMSLYKLPMILVCENNMYAQSTSIKSNLSGDINLRASAFGIKVYELNTWDYDGLIKFSEEAIINARKNIPSFIHINTYRLKAHSKGDDDRDKNEIEEFEKKDMISNIILNDDQYGKYYNEIKNKIKTYSNSVIKNSQMDKNIYIGSENNKLSKKYLSCDVKIERKQSDLINNYFHESINDNKNILLIGEDIKDPYGGAFKITKGLSNKYKENVISTPISEAAIVGMGIGLSILGFKPYVEIMFGDFITYAFDQIVSNASKFYHMYNKKYNVPLVIRTPMGGNRGYGPTHSQSIEKFFIGINNIQIVALNTLLMPNELYESIENFEHLTLLIENKVDYGRLINRLPKSINYEFKKSNSDYPIIIGEPVGANAKISIITYGGSVHPVLESIDDIFFEFEEFIKIIVITKLYPVDIEELSFLTKDSDYIITVEESNIEGGFGSEIVSGLSEIKNDRQKKYLRIGSENVPIPSTKKLENEILVSKDLIVRKMKEIL